MIVIDTHVWLWWVSDPAQLSDPARQAIDAAALRHELFVSTISAWEVAMLVEKGRLTLTLDVRDWIARSEALPFLTFAPLTNVVAVEAVRLPNFPHADPADRIIAATTLSLGAALVSKDEKLRGYPPLRTIW